MRKYEQIYEMADVIFDSGEIYWWTQRGNVVWACKPVSKGPMLTQ